MDVLKLFTIPLLLATLLLSACNPAMRMQPRTPPTAIARPVRVVPVLDLDTEAKAALKLAISRVADAKHELPGFTGADAPLANARAAAAEGDNAQTISYSELAVNRADLVMLGKYKGRAKALVKKLGNTTGLSDAQYKRLQAAEAAMADQHPREAYEIANSINQEIEASTKRHRVRKGESLWTISKRNDIYANPWLWPLIWQANRSALKSPSSIRAGQVLKIRANPSVDEVLRAVKFAHEHSGTRIKIGAIKELTPEQSDLDNH